MPRDPVEMFGFICGFFIFVGGAYAGWVFFDVGVRLLFAGFAGYALLKVVVVVGTHFFPGPRTWTG